jgi:hypothetical protein
MSSAKTLQQQNRRALLVFLVANVIMFFVINSLPTALLADFDLVELGIQGGVSAAWAVGAHTLTAVLVWQVGQKWKNILVFRRKRNPLPGCRAFSELADQDERIDKKALEKVVGSFPTDPRAQNQAWYKLYKRVEDLPVVLDVHGKFLLFREMTTLVVMLAPFLVVPSAFISSWGTAGICALILAAEYMFISRAGQTAGERFVTTVMARASKK